MTTQPDHKGCEGEPKKVFLQAKRYSKSTWFVKQHWGINPSRIPYHSRFLNKHMQKILQKVRFASNVDKVDDIRYIIQDNCYRNKLYHRLETADMQSRTTLSARLEQKNRQVQLNLEKLKSKQHSRTQRIDKHMVEVRKKHEELETNFINKKNDEAIKLRKSLLEFYAKQRQRKMRQNKRKLNVPTCYEDAMYRREVIYQKNEEFSQKSERECRIRLAKNSGKEKSLLSCRMIKSAENKRKQSVLLNNCEIEEEKKQHWIQVYGEDLDLINKAKEYKVVQDSKQKQKIHKFIKERVEKWKDIKKRKDEEKEVVPDRCLNIMEKTTKASFRHTVSSFKESSSNFREWNQQNRSLMKQRNEELKDHIVEIHTDMRLRNIHSSKINNRMNSLKSKAHKLSKECSCK